MRRLKTVLFLWALLVPLVWVYAIVSERAARRDGAMAEVSTTWGGKRSA